MLSSPVPTRNPAPRDGWRSCCRLAASYVQCAGRGELAPELKSLAAELEEKGYPAIHHSEAYVEAYLPAYRVVEEAFAAKHGWCEEALER